MEDKRFQRMIEEISALTPAQFKALVQAYAGQCGQNTGRVWSRAVYSTSEQHLAALGINHACPGCGSIAVVQNGANDAGIQRFRCQDCGKSFTHFTGTLLEKSRFPWEVWVAVLKMASTMTLW